MNKTWQVVLAFIGIFLMGSVAGGFVGTRLATKTVVERKVTEQFTVQQLIKYADQLELTREQRERLRPIIFRAGDEVRELRKNVAETLDRMDRDIKRQLTDEQQKKFDVIRADQTDREHRWQKWVREQRKMRDMRPSDQIPAASPAPGKTEK